MSKTCETCVHKKLCEFKGITIEGSCCLYEDLEKVIERSKKMSRRYETCANYQEVTCSNKEKETDTMSDDYTKPICESCIHEDICSCERHYYKCMATITEAFKKLDNPIGLNSPFDLLPLKCKHYYKK